MLILGIWIFILFFFIYSLGSAWGGRKAGFEAILGFIGVFCFYGAIGWLIWETLKETAKYIK